MMRKIYFLILLLVVSFAVHALDTGTSPKNDLRLFSKFVDSDWYVAVAKVNSKEERIIKNTRDTFQPTWASDGKSFFCHSLRTIYWLDLDGKILKKWDVRSIVPHGDMDSASQMANSPDGRWLALQVGMTNEKQTDPKADQAPQAVWLLDIESGKTTRATHPGDKIGPIGSYFQ